MNALVGYTGFVGSNLDAYGEFDARYNSRNIEAAYGTRPDLLVYAGLRAEKYLANSNPDKDMALIRQAEDNIKRIAPKKLVLISTIDVFADPRGVDEDADICTEHLQPYGYDRYRLECQVREKYPDALIIRLPGLFGRNIKKNFIYDFINVIPTMLKEEKFNGLAASEPGLKAYYQLQDNGFYKVRELSSAERNALKKIFGGLDFSALNFTDSQSRYQFYNLANLWADMNRAMEAGIRLWHPATEPMSAAELYWYLMGREFENKLDGKPADYDYRTKYAELFGGAGGYICSKSAVMRMVKEFVEEYGIEEY